MEQIISVIAASICAIITAFSGLVIAYLHKKTKQLEEKNKKKDEKKDALHNGFRHEVYTRLLDQEKKINKICVDIDLVKSLVVEK